MTHEEKKARAFYERAELFRNAGKVDEAIRELLALPGSTYDGMYAKCMNMLVEMCLCSEDARYGTRFDLRNTLSRMKRGNQNIESDTEKLVRMVFGHVKTMTAQMQAKMEAMTSNPSSEDLLIATLTGIPVAERARDRYCVPCQRAAQKVAQGLFGRYGLSLSSKAFPVYIRFAYDYVTHLHEVGMKDAVVKTCYWVVEELLKLTVEPLPSNANAAQEVEESRKNFFKSSTSGAAAIKLLCHMVGILTEEGNWPNDGWHVLEGLKRIADALTEAQGAQQLRGEAYETISEVFWECGITTYHAYCLSVAAKQRTDNTPTRAVLAALLCPEVNEHHNPFGPNYDSHAVHDDVAELFGESRVSRSELLTALKIDGSAARADPLTCPLVTAFDAEVANPATDFASLHVAVSSLLAKDAALVKYEKPLHQALLRRQMESLAANSVCVNMQDLVKQTAKMTTLQYLRDVEPSFLQDSSLPVEIDSKTNTVIFRNATRAKVLSSFTKLASSIDLRNTTRNGNPNSSATLAAITVEDLLSAHTHARLLHDVQHSCQQAAHQRKKDLEDKAKEMRQAKTENLRSAEAEKQEKARQKKYKKLLAEYRERQRQERCKKVLEKLRAKYPHFKIDNAIASKSANAFEDELTSALAAYKRIEVEEDSRDALRANLFERALRQLEIPRQKEMAAAHADQHRAERAAARQNYLAQHRKEYDRRQEERIVLQKFLPDAQAFLENWQKAAGGEKVSKRDEQQQLIEQEKRRLAEQS